MAVLETTKSCNRCGEIKPLSDFYRDKNRKGGHYPNCKSCHAVYTNSYRSSEKGRAYTRSLRFKQYGITEADYKLMNMAQASRCAICGTTDSRHNQTDDLLIDHDHTSGRVRGLLCVRCNAGIGHFMDDPELLRSAIAYLEKN